MTPAGTSAPRVQVPPLTPLSGRFPTHPAAPSPRASEVDDALLEADDLTAGDHGDVRESVAAPGAEGGAADRDSGLEHVLHADDTGLLAGRYEVERHLVNAVDLVAQLPGQRRQIDLEGPAHEAVAWAAITASTSMWAISRVIGASVVAVGEGDVRCELSHRRDNVHAASGPETKSTSVTSVQHQSVAAGRRASRE